MEDEIQMVLNPDPDAALIAKIIGGEKRAFEKLIRKYNQRLFRIGMTILSDERETEDAMQWAYISAYQHLPEFEQRASFGTWLVRIMLNQCYQQQRKKKAELVGLEQTVHLSNMKTPANDLINKELGKVLEHVIADLPEKYRLVFMLREVESMSVRETSSALGLEESNVKVRLNRAKTMLRDRLKGYMKDEVYAFHLSRCDQMVERVFSNLS